MFIKTAKAFEGNAARAARLGLKEAPTLRGNFFTRQACLENLAENMARTGKGEPPRFLQMWLETKDECNLKCPMCFTAAAGAFGRAKNEFLEWERALRAGKAAGIGMVGIAGCGEPLLDPAFPQLAKAVKGNGLDLVLFTNGTKLTKDNIALLRENCAAVVTKLFALEPAAHDVLVGVKGEYVRTRRALADLLDAGFREPNLAIDVVVAKQNRGELATLLRMCRMLEVIPYFERMAIEGKAKKLNGSMVLAQDEADAAFEELRQIDEKEFSYTWALTPGMPVLAHAETDKRTVAFLQDAFGNVHPGDTLDKVMGNIRNTEGGINEILGNAAAWNAYYNEVAQEVGLEKGKAANEMDEAAKINEMTTVMRQTAFNAAMGMTSGGQHVHEHPAPDVNGGFKLMDFAFWTTEIEGAVARDGNYAAILRTVHEPVGEACVNFHLKLFKVMPDGKTELLRHDIRLNDFEGKRIAAVDGEGIAVDFFGERVVV
ncbi:MAG: radical SAM protein [Candidatus Micrarchaeia archaeon]|jgi:MoaA/NifB/PqqE/SkfB family radical SAM enzyme